MVVHMVLLRFGCREVETVGKSGPFLARYLSVAFYRVVVAKGILRFSGRQFEVALPVQTVGGVHSIRGIKPICRLTFIHYIQDKVFPKNRFVFNVK